MSVTIDGNEYWFGELEAYRRGCAYGQGDAEDLRREDDGSWTWGYWCDGEWHQTSDERLHRVQLQVIDGHQFLGRYHVIENGHLMSVAWYGDVWITYGTMEDGRGDVQESLDRAVEKHHIATLKPWLSQWGASVDPAGSDKRRDKLFEIQRLSDEIFQLLADLGLDDKRKDVLQSLYALTGQPAYEPRPVSEPRPVKEPAVRW